MLDRQVPEGAEKIYAKNETFRKQVNKLDLIVFRYNFVVTNLNNVEEPLIITRIEKMNETLKPGIDELKWKSPDIDAFIDRSHKIIQEVYSIVTNMKEHLEQIKKSLHDLDKHMLDRKRGIISAEEFRNNLNLIQQIQSDNITKEGGNINRKIKEISDNVGVNKKNKEFRDYQEFINDIVIDGLCKVICTSLYELNNLIDIKTAKRTMEYIPLLDIKLSIQKTSIQYDPPVEGSVDSNSIRGIMSTVISNFVGYSTCISRLDTGAGDYLNEMRDNFEIRSILAVLNQNLDLICAKTEDYSHKFDEFSLLWTKDPQVAFNEFLNKDNEASNQVAGGEESEKSEDPDKKNPIMLNIVTKIPPFDQFDKKISELKKLKTSVTQINPQEDIEWVRINSNPLKNSLEERSVNWINTYTTFS
jgi:dynein heavy chain